MRLSPRRARRLEAPPALTVTAVVVLLLAGCSATASSTAPPPGPSATPSSAPAPGPPQYRFDVFQMKAVVPTAYRQHRIEVGSYFINLRTMRQRDDPLAGVKVEPASCRTMIQTGGFTMESVAGFRSDTPAAIGDAAVKTAAGEGFVSAVVYELTGAEAESYQNLRFLEAPECRQISVGSGSANASIVERELTEFGTGARYIVRTYPKAGKSWSERTLFFRMPTSAGEVRAFGPVGSEADFLAFARLLRDRATAKLK